MFIHYSILFNFSQSHSSGSWLQSLILPLHCLCFRNWKLLERERWEAKFDRFMVTNCWNGSTTLIYYSKILDRKNAYLNVKILEYSRNYNFLFFLMCIFLFFESLREKWYWAFELSAIKNHSLQSHLFGMKFNSKFKFNFESHDLASFANISVTREIIL